MKPLDKDEPARMRREAAERVAKAKRNYRNSLCWLVGTAMLMGILIGYGAGLLLAHHWSGGRDVIFIQVDGRGA